MSKFFPLYLPNKTCVLPFNFALERDLRNIFYYQHGVESYTDQVLNFYIFDRHKYIHTESSGLEFWSVNLVMGLNNFFFVLQDLIDRIDS